MADGPSRSMLMRTLGFLSRLPVDSRHYEDTEHLETADDAALFPMAGVVIAMPGAMILLLSGVFGGPAILAAALAVLLTVAITGALHEDGLADTADGLGGGKTTERRLAIMRDSSIGSYGVLALVGSVLIRVLAIGVITAEAGAWAGALAFLAVNAAARAAMVWHWSNLPPARADGVSASSGQPLDTSVNLALLIGGMIFVLLGLWSAGIWATAFGALLAIGAIIAFTRLCQHLIGGQTGDTIGGSEQIVEAALLVGLAMAA